MNVAQGIQDLLSPDQKLLSWCNITNVRGGILWLGHYLVLEGALAKLQNNHHRGATRTVS